MNIRIISIVTALNVSTVFLQADTLRMRDGRLIPGVFESADRDDIRFRPDGRDLRHFNISDVDSVVFGNGPADNRDRDRNRDQGRDRDPGSDRDRSPQNGYAGQPNGAPRYAEPRNGLILPAGTAISVRMIDGIDSDVTRAGDTYHASLDQPIVVDGRTIAPQGSDAMVQVVRVQQGGRLEGREEVALALASFTANGRVYDLNTNNETVSSGSRGKQSGEVIGGGAALGAIIGAIAGGGRGAAIGAAGGAAVGTGAQVLRGQRVKVSPETRLSFTLNRDVQL